jgi:small subunit ribosomal protein S4
MIIKSKYKIARRLGSSVFEKTQTAKYTLRTERKMQKKLKRPAARSNFGKQLIEKQKVRYTYALSEKQFSKYVKKVITKNVSNSTELLFSFLEKRLDNIALRSGFASTRRAAQQMVSHGHLTVNGKRVNIPSYELKIGDVVGIREGSKEKSIFSNLEERISDTNIPSWISLNKSKNEITVVNEPNYIRTEHNFDLEQVIQFYKR